jgi:hypothetical protein
MISIPGGARIVLPVLTGTSPSSASSAPTTFVQSSSIPTAPQTAAPIWLQGAQQAATTLAQVATQVQAGPREAAMQKLALLRDELKNIDMWRCQF